MGWDISYHPISETQIKEWYFNVLDDPTLIEKRVAENNIDDFYQDKYQDVINFGLKVKPDSIFDKTHGYYIAVMQGLFQQFFYIRGGALSFSENSLLEKYFKPWEDIVPTNKLTKQVENQIIENYCSGVYIPKDKVIELLNDYTNNPNIKEELDHLFSHDRIGIFLKALEFAKNNDLGLLEATEVIEPNPMDLNETSCYSNLYNCDIEGPMLYQKATLEQIAELTNLSKEEASQVEYQKISVPSHQEKEENKPEKKSFWKKLFGK